MRRFLPRRYAGARPVGEADPPKEVDIYVQRLARRRLYLHVITLLLPYIRTAMYVVGYTWMLLIPWYGLSQTVWVDENALQPGQVTTYWDWSDVHAADAYLHQIEKLLQMNASSLEKAQYVQHEFLKLGLKAETQSYRIENHFEIKSGVNAYGVYPVPRASGAEAMVISASWLSVMDEGGGQPNARGVASILALARFLSRYSLWAKDLVFVVNDGYLDGMHAWLNSYHGLSQKNMEAGSLKYISGVIWTALCLDYPGHSFSHVGIFYEGLNGRLPNQDLINSVVHITALAGGGVPTILYDNIETTGLSKTLQIFPVPAVQRLFDRPDVRTYVHRASNVKRHLQYEALNRASGVHGLFHRYRIDAITLFANPAPGPHGFHTIGKIMESSLRTMNNMLERLHASFFFYILTSSHTFVNFGGYLASVLLISIAMIFGGLRSWVVAGWEQTMVVMNVPASPEANKGWPAAAPMSAWTQRDRPSLKALVIMALTHFVGWLAYLTVTSSGFAAGLKVGMWPFIRYSAWAISLLPLLVCHPQLRQHLRTFDPPSYNPQRSSRQAPVYMILHSFNLFSSSIVISITSVLNYSLAAILAVLLGVPLNLTKGSSVLRALIILFVSPAGLLEIAIQAVGQDHVVALFFRTVSEWEVLGVWFLPFACFIYLPLTMQGLIVCLLPVD